MAWQDAYTWEPVQFSDIVERDILRVTNTLEDQKYKPWCGTVLSIYYHTVLNHLNMRGGPRGVGGLRIVHDYPWLTYERARKKTKL